MGASTSTHRKRAPTLYRLGVVATALALGVGCQQEAGRFELVIDWGTLGAPPAGQFLHGRVIPNAAAEGRPLVVDATLLARSGFSADAVPATEVSSLEFEEVPHGERYAIILEVRDERDPQSTLRRYGVSDLFDLNPGEVTQVSMKVDLVSAPEGAGTMPIVPIGALATTEAFVRSQNIELLLTTNTGVEAIVSHFQELPEDETRTRIIPLEAPEDPACRDSMSRPCQYTVDWDLEFGLDDRCVEQDRCPRRIYLRFRDANGQRSERLSRDVILDTLSPTIIEQGTSVNPPSARADQPMQINLAFSELVSLTGFEMVGAAIQPGRTTPEIEDLEFPTQFASSFVFQVPNSSELIAGTSSISETLRFEIRAAGEDRAGNPYPLTVVATAEVDPTRPVIRNEALEPTRVGGPQLDVHLSFEVSEDIEPENAALVIGYVVDGRSLTFDAENQCLRPATPLPDGFYPWSCTRPLQEALADRASVSVPVTIRVLDQAGNDGENEEPLVLEIDYAPPELAAPGFSFARTVVREGDDIRVTIFANETLGTNIALLWQDDALSCSLTAQTLDSRTFTCATDGLASGEVRSVILTGAALVDTATNAATIDLTPRPEAERTVVIDGAVPRIEAIAALNTPQGSGSSRQDRIELNYRRIESNFAEETIRAGGRDVSSSCSTVSPPGSSVDRRCIFSATDSDISGSEGALPIVIRVEDRAGNESTASTSVFLDFEPPQLVSASFSPEVAGLDEQVTLVLTANDALSAGPTGLTLSGGNLAFTCGAPAGRTIQCSATVAGGTTQGRFSLPPFDIADDARNQASVTATDEVTIDPRPPVITIQSAAVTPQRGGAAPRVDDVVLIYTRVEDNFASESVRVGTRAVTNRCSQATGSGSTVTRRCEFTVSQSDLTSGQTVGVLPVVVQVSDRAGNQTTESTSIDVDYEAPSLVSATFSPNPAGLDDEVTVALNASENLSSGPSQLTLVASNLTFNCSSPSGSRILCTARVTASTPERALALPAMTLTDTLGNRTTVNSTERLRVDTTPPGITLGVTPATRLFGPSQNSLTLTASFDGSIAVANIGVSRDGQPVNIAQRCGSPSGAITSLRCTIPVTGTAGEIQNQTVSIRATDEAGNTADASESITVDFQPPSVSQPVATPAFASSLSEIQLRMQVSEDLGSGATPAVTGWTGPSTLGFVEVTPRISGVLVFRPSVGVTGADGDYSAPQISGLIDGLGNSATASTLTVASFVLDTTSPTVDQVTLAVANQGGGGIPRSDDITLNFRRTDSNFAFEEVRAGTRTLTGTTTCTTLSTRGDQVERRCSFSVTANDLPNQATVGTLPIVIQVADRAGNQGTQSTSVDLDFQGPSLVSASFSPNPAGVGDDVTLTLTANENLQSAPSAISLPGTNLSFSCGAPNGTQVVCTERVDASSTLGVHGLPTIRIADAAGNVQDELRSEQLEVDTAAPQVVISLNPPSRTSFGPDRPSVRFSATLGETVSVANVAVDIGGQAVSLTQRCSNPTGDVSNVSCTVPVPFTQGQATSQAISVRATDGAGNTGNASVSVTADYEAPSVSQAVISPAFAADLAQVELRLQVSEAIKASANPTLSGWTGGPLSFAEVTPRTPGNLVFRYASGAATDGVIGTPSLTGIEDQLGNVAAGIPLSASFVLDTVTPTIAIDSLTVINSGGGGATRSDAVTLVYTRTETNFAGESVRVGTRVVDSSACSVSGPTSPVTRTCNFTVTPSDLGRGQLEGTLPVVVQVLDRAGNQGTATTNLDLDYALPDVTNVTFSPSPAIDGDVVTLTITLDEPLAAAPSVVVEDSSGIAGPSFTCQSPTGTTVQCTSIQVTAASPQGIFRLQDFMGADAMGNQGTVTVPASAGTLVIDTIAPTLSALSATPSRVSAVAGFNVLSLPFTISETPATLSVTIDGQPATCPATINAGANACAFTLSPSGPFATQIAAQAELTAPVVVRAADLAGNVSVLSTSVGLDFRPPSAAASFNPATAGDGSAVVLTVTPSEALAVSFSPVLNWQMGVAPNGLGAPVSSGLSLLYPLTVSASTGNGDFELESITLRDDVGNEDDAAVLASLIVDAIPPEIRFVPASGPSRPGLRVSPGRARSGDIVTATFQVSDNRTGSTVSVEASLLGQALDCGGTSFTQGVDITCTSAALTAPVPATTTTEQVIVRAIDTARNVLQASENLVLDFEAPAIIGAEVSYVPGFGNLVSFPDAAKEGTTIVLRLTFSEEVLLPPASFDIRFTEPGGSVRTLAFSRVAATSASATYQGVVPSAAGVAPADGNYQDADTAAPCAGGLCASFRPQLAVSDVVGNAATLTSFPNLTLRIRTSDPVLQIVQSQVSFIRSPLGNPSAETVNGFQVPGGPYFALGPNDGFSGAANLPANTFRLAGGVEPRFIRVWADGDKDQALAPSAIEPDATTGAWPRSDLRLTPADVPSAYVSGIDLAGNESAAVRIEQAWFVATSRQLGNQATPHEVTSAGTVTGPLEDRFPVLASSVSSPDSSLDTVSAQYRWKDRMTSPSGRRDSAMAFDSARARVVLFGGDDASVGVTTIVNDTWEWDGESWTEVQTPPTATPDGRTSHGMVYDSRRGRVVLFGGRNGNTTFDDTWEFDGRGWVRIPTTPAQTPAGRSNHAMAYDPINGVVVMFGGSNSSFAPLDDTWEWDGESWTEVNTPVLQTPPARSDVLGAFDTQVNRVRIFGGSNGSVGDSEIWERVGSGWTRVPASGSPPYSLFRDLAFDSVNNELVVYQRSRTYLLRRRPSGTYAWTPAITSTPKPLAFQSHAMTYDHRRERVVLFGDDAPDGDTWEWDGSSWELVNRDERFEPDSFDRPHVAYDGARAETMLLTQGTASTTTLDTWLWNGKVWSQGAPSVRPSRDTDAVYYDPSLRTVLRVGRTGSAPAVSSSWAGTNWTLPRAIASGVDLLELAYRPSSAGSSLMYGVFVGSTTASAVFRYNGFFWSRVFPSRLPPARSETAMVYDTSLGRVVLFGGGEVFSSFSRNDTWEWTGSTWAGPVGGTSPAERREAGLTYSDDRRDVILFGGYTMFNRFNDTWQRSGRTWSRITPADRSPPQMGRIDMTYDSARDRAVLVGNTQPTATWTLEMPKRSSLQFAAALPADLESDRVNGLRVRAFCGGTSGGGAGAELFGWVINSDGQGSYVSLGSNGAGLSTTPTAALLPHAETTAAASQRFVLGRKLYFQCRPNGDAETGEATVGLDFMEVRVGYQAQ